MLAFSSKRGRNLFGDSAQRKLTMDTPQRAECGFFASETFPLYTNDTMGQKKILAIEDDVFLSSLVSGKLIEAGFSVVTAGTGTDGLAKAKFEHPHLILLDIMLPDMGGYEILEKIKADPETAHIPVIILSNLGGRDEIEKGVQMGASSYLIKSNILPHEVVEMVSQLTMDERLEVVPQATPPAQA